MSTTSRDDLTPVRNVPQPVTATIPAVPQGRMEHVQC